MKKNLLIIFSFLFSTILFSNEYKIKEVNYDIESSKIQFMGKTSVYALEQKVSLDKSIIFYNESELNDYILIYKQNLENLRAFDSIEINYEIKETETSSLNDIIINVFLVDSMHILGLPHVISYNSNDGWKPKLKLKDTNFLGTLNTLSTDIFAVVDFENEGASNAFGFTFDYDYPFKAGIFDAALLNDYSFSYTFANPSPEWNFSTGIQLIYPLKNMDMCFEFKQKEIRNFDYINYNDETYFSENGKIYFPFYLLNTANFGKLTYTPSLSSTYNWDFNGISVNNTNLSSPTISAAHSLSFGKVNWLNNMQKGFSVIFSNSYNYNFQRQYFYPYFDLNFHAAYFISMLDKNFLNKAGIKCRLFTFFYLEKPDHQYFYGSGIGSYLRGIRDNQYFGNEEPYKTTSDSIIINFDLPIHLLTFTFNNKILKYFNCEVHVSPFIDIALTKNRTTSRFFSPKDGFYSSGFEVLVYPQKWSSFTVRGSLGVDIGKLLLSDYIDTSWRTNTSLYEISLGLGLFY